MKTIIAFIALTFATGAFAEATIKVKPDLSQIVVIIGDHQLADLPMHDGLAMWTGNLNSARVDTAAEFLGFATYEVVAKLVANGMPFTQQRSPQGSVSPANIRGVYMIFVSKGRGQAFPVSFSAFGIGVHASDGTVWHSGTSVISDNPDDWEPWK